MFYFAGHPGEVDCYPSFFEQQEQPNACNRRKIFGRYFLMPMRSDSMTPLPPFGRESAVGRMANKIIFATWDFHGAEYAIEGGPAQARARRCAAVSAIIRAEK